MIDELLVDSRISPFSTGEKGHNETSPGNTGATASEGWRHLVSTYYKTMMLLLASASALASHHAHADVLEVPGDYPTIGTALVAAVDGDTILVAPGLYDEGPLNTGGKSILLMSSGGPSQTTITNTSGVNDTVITVRGSDGIIEVAGFTISGGNAASGAGGGIEIVSSGGGDPFGKILAFRLTDCIISDNAAASRGGGLYADENSSVVITDCIFRNNTAGSSGGGAALMCLNAATVLRTRFEGNLSGNEAGGLAIGSDASFKDPGIFLVESTVFTGNFATSAGAAIVATPEPYIPESSCTVLNCTFSGNVSPRDPAIHTIMAGMKMDVAVTTVMNCILSNNSGSQMLRMESELGEDAPLSGNDFSHTLFDDQDEATIEAGDGLVLGSAGFADEFGADGISGTGDENFRLSPLSIAVDRGSPSIQPVSDQDVYQNTRDIDDPLVTLPIGTGTIDFGASEFDTSGLSSRMAVWDEAGGMGLPFMDQTNWFENAEPNPGLPALVRTPGYMNSGWLDSQESTDSFTFDGGSMALQASFGAPSGTGLYMQTPAGQPGSFDVLQRTGETTRLMINGLDIEAGRVTLEAGTMEFSNVAFRMLDGNILIGPEASVGLYAGTFVDHAGTFAPSILNHGTLFVNETQLLGDYMQSATSNGAYTQPSGFIGFEIGPHDDKNSTPDLLLTGDAMLGGTLGIRGSKDGLPSLGVPVPLLGASSISDTFELVVARDIPDGVSVNLAIEESVQGGSSEATIELVPGSDTEFDDAYFSSIAPDGIEDAVLADVDGDGDDDLIISLTNPAGQEFTHVGIIENLGTAGGFWNGFDALAIGVNTVKISGSANGLAAGDLDSDGRIDAIVANKAGGTVHVLQNQTVPGTIIFNDVLNEDTSVDLPAGTAQPTGTWVGDLDFDGRPDVVVNNDTDGSVVSFQNVSSLAISLGSASSSIPLHKIRRISPTGTGKSRNEVPFGSSTPQKNANGSEGGGESEDEADDDSGKVQVGNTSAGNQLDLRLSWDEYEVDTDPVDAAAGDLDGDGSKDIVTANRAGESISILMGNGTGSYDPAITIAVENECLATNLGDFDGDGDLDIAVLVDDGNGSSSVRILRNDTDITSTTTFCLESDTLFEGNGVNRILVGRLDDDGIDDILVTATTPSLQGPLPGWMAALGGMESDCFGDINGDGTVDAADLALLLGAWGPAGSSPVADLNKDGFVNATDLAYLLGSWGDCGSSQLED